MAKPLRIKVTGIKEIRRNLLRVEKLMPAAVDGAMYREGLQIMAVSIRRVPVDFGRLRSTHFVAPPSAERGAEVLLGYGTDYAIHVHENLKARHTVGEAKFLQKPVDEARPGMLARIGRDAENLFEQGRGLGSISSAGISQKPKQVREGKGTRSRRGRR